MAIERRAGARANVGLASRAGRHYAPIEHCRTSLPRTLAFSAGAYLPGVDLERESVAERSDRC